MVNLYSGSVKSGEIVAETLSIIPCCVIRHGVLQRLMRIQC
jgi:hypothetical protein